MFDSEQTENNIPNQTPNQRPDFKKLPYLSKVLPVKERWLVRFLGFLIITSAIGLFLNNYGYHFQFIPKVGGEYNEGVLGQPRFANPILCQGNEADKDIVGLVYSSLFKYDQDANLIPDLAKEYIIEENGLAYIVPLRNDVFWHDGEPLNADDVIFTIKTIQDPEYKSPLYNNWQGVQTEKIDDFTIKFKLNNAYGPFPHNLVMGILPKHLWAGISASNFALAEYNLKPVGSGPYKFKQLSKDSSGQIISMEFIRNENFYSAGSEQKEKNQKPYLENIALKFFANEDEMIEAEKKGQVDGLSLISGQNQSKISGVRVYEIGLPVYYAVFFNQTESKVLSDKAVRTALTYATNKQEIISRVLNDKGKTVNSPFLSDWPGYAPEEKIFEFSLDQAASVLETAGWKDSDNDGQREKTNSTSAAGKEQVKLEFSLLTTDWPELKQVAELLKEQWEKAGFRINIEVVDTTTIQQEYVRPRKYQALLFGEALNADPDPFAFWHSSQIKDPGLNLALYKNTEADKLLEKSRQILDLNEKTQKNSQLQKIITEDMPALFLYSPSYLYPVGLKIKGINLNKITQYSYRFSQIENWYVNTSIVWR